MNEDIFVFVYGTLRKGFEGNALLSESRFLGYARTRKKFALYVDLIPYAYKEKRVSSIVGEVYQIDELTLEILDDFEGHPDEYQRELVDVVLESGIQLTPWIYFNPNPKGTVIASGDYTNR